MLKKCFALSLLLLCSVVASAQEKEPPLAVKQIDEYSRKVDKYPATTGKSVRLFGLSDNDKWIEYKTDAAMKAGNANQSAMVLSSARKIASVAETTQSNSRDWLQFVVYYFRADGSLAKAEARLSTTHGNVIVLRDYYFDAAGKEIYKKIQIQDMATQKTLKSDTDFMDEPIIIYKKISELPYYSFFEVKPTIAKKPRRT